MRISLQRPLALPEVLSALIPAAWCLGRDPSAPHPALGRVGTWRGAHPWRPQRRPVLPRLPPRPRCALRWTRAASP